MVKLFELTLALLTCVSTVLAQYATQATLYEHTGASGASTWLGIYAPDLEAHSFNNRARSVCVTGVWLFYDLTQFNGNINAGMEYVFGNRYCVDFSHLGGAVSSARYTGSPNDYRLPSLTLYSGTFFQGQEEYTSFVDLPNLKLNGSVASLIVTGSPSEGWTLYDSPNYVGNSVCVYPPMGTVFEPAFIHDTNIITVPHNTIHSIKRGCFGSRKVVAKAKSVKQGTKTVPSEIGPCLIAV